MPRLVKKQDAADGSPELVPHGYEEGDHYLRTIHGRKTGDLRNTLPPRMPDESMPGGSDESERVLKPKEVSKILRSLKHHKAVGVGIIANEALIACVDIIERHLEHLFEAYKSAYSCPKNWRPITLLGALSKVLDKLVANRLTTFATRTACLPANQFGISGKSTTSALQFILNEVYTAWSVGQVVTLMGLDITGAYPRVNRDRLLEAMARKNVPAWIIRFVHSWLYGSHTDLHLPGRRPQNFFISLGIPQGSSLSPILFLFFAAGLLEIKITELHGVLAAIISYVDDTYIIVRSKNFNKNCQALVTLHDRVQVWAKANDVEFAPHKYGLLHFQRGPPAKRCRLLPSIQGLTDEHLKAPEGYHVPHLRILGVMVDTQLKWGPHIDHIAQKVKTQQYNFWHISRTQTGPRLHQMRQLYMAKVLLIFAYACGAWYLPGDTDACYTMGGGQMERLEKLHRAFLLDVSGGMVGTSAEVIFKELHIPRMSVFLEKTATAQRARELDTPQHKDLCRTRIRAWASRQVVPERRNPYHQLDKIARATLNDAHKLPPVRGRPGPADCVKQLLGQRAEAKSREAWEAHKLTFTTKRAGRIPPAYSDPRGWGPHNLNRYANLPRPQSSMLFQCRVERAAVNATLYKMRVHKDNEDRSKDTPSCPCGHPNQTIQHLFSHCPDLEEARARELVLRVGTANVDDLLERYPAEASAFAVTHFGICKNKDVPLFLPRRGDEHEAEGEGEGTGKASGPAKRKREGDGDGPASGPELKKTKKQGGGPGPAPRRGRQQQQQQKRRQHGAGAKGREGMSVRRTKCRRRADKALKIWKKNRREAVGGGG